jgi:hypothetical protein
MMSLLLITAAIAAPPNHTVVKETNGCILYAGPADTGGIAPMFADCHWPEVKPERLQGLLGTFDAYDAYIFAIASCTVLRTEGTRTLVHQVQTAPAIAQREVAVWMEAVTVPGGMRYTWENDPNEPLALSQGSIRAPRNTGYWEVTAHPDGGARVAHAVSYDPGGRVPAWLVRRFSVGGLDGVMTEVRDLAAKASGATDHQEP